MSRRHYSLVNLVPPDTIHRWIIFHLINNVSPRVCVLRWFGIFILHYNWKPHWQLVVTQAEQPSGIAPAFRMTNQNNGKIHKKISLITCNQKEFFLYPACTKRGGLSSLDHNFRGPIAPIALVVFPPLFWTSICHSWKLTFQASFPASTLKVINAWVKMAGVRV